MTHKQALEIVFTAAEANASGSDRCATIHLAVRHVKGMLSLMGGSRSNSRLTLSRGQADRLLKTLAIAAKELDRITPSTAQGVREIYADLAEAYAAAGYDVEGIKS